MSYIKRFEEIQHYFDPGSSNQECRDILPRGIVEGTLIGFNKVTGPGNNGMGNHADFTQIFIITRGEGVLHFGAQRIRPPSCSRSVTQSRWWI